MSPAKTVVKTKRMMITKKKIDGEKITTDIAHPIRQ